MDNWGKGDSSDEEKPLKKARYIWEVKGKGHLKRSGPDNFNSPSCSSGSTSRNCCVESFLAKTEEIMDKCSSDEEDEDKLPLENCIENEIPVTLVSSQPKNQDYYLKKWQARQIARGFVDNTINSMLENWTERPLHVSNFVEDCEQDGQVEDDAILMAIQSHGLQSGVRPSSSTFSTVNMNNNNIGGHNTQSEIMVFQSPVTDNMENLQKEQEIESSSSSESVSSISNSYEIDLGDPMDFLNAAVSVAIQKKGLTY